MVMVSGRWQDACADLVVCARQPRGGDAELCEEEWGGAEGGVIGCRARESCAAVPVRDAHPSVLRHAGRGEGGQWGPRCPPTTAAPPLEGLLASALPEESLNQARPPTETSSPRQQWPCASRCRSGHPST